MLTRAPARTRPCSSLTVPMSVPVNPCASATRGSRTQPTATTRSSVSRTRVADDGRS
jgi:hypothetical protein